MRCGEARSDRDPYAVVVVVSTDRVGGYRIHVVDQAVVELDCEHFSNDLHDVVDVVVEVERLQVDVPGRATGVERSEEHAALEDEGVRVVGHHQACEEALESVERHQFVGWAAATRARRCNAR